MTRALALCCALLLACDGDDEASEASCDLETSVAIEAHAGAPLSDGSVTVYGAIRFSSPAPDPERERVERTVYAVYVADQEVLPTADSFNFRSWTVTVAADRVEAFATTADSGARRASLPVRAFLQGDCVLEMAEAAQPVVELPDAVDAAVPDLVDAAPEVDAAPPPRLRLHVPQGPG